MAARARRHRLSHLMEIEPIQLVQDSPTVSRYDMSLPQNWTVGQLRAELTRNNVSFRKTAKKSQLIQLCKNSGLINTQHHADNGDGNSGQGHENSEMSSLSNTVAELQHTVSMLSRNLDRLVQSSTEFTQNDTSNQLMTNPGSIFQRSSESETPMNGQQNVRDNVQEILCLSEGPRFTERTGGSGTLTSPAIGTRTRFGYSVESLPFIETVHPTLRKQIVEGKDVNLAALLIPYYTGRHADSSEIVKNKDKLDPRLQNKLNLPQFIQAFGIYKNIMCEVHPSRREELDLYERDIVDMASRYGGHGFYEYHRMFSAEAAAHLSYANRKVDWSVRNNKLFTTIFVNQKSNTCNLCSSSLHVSSFCPNQLNDNRNSHNSAYSPNRVNKDMRGRSRITFQGKEICNNFNVQTGCNYRNCPNLHICLSCKKEHPQHTCSASKNSVIDKGKAQK